MTSLDQQNTVVRISNMSVQDSKVTIEFSQIGARFVGESNADRTENVGKWTQGDAEYELTIRRVDI